MDNPLDIKVSAELLKLARLQQRLEGSQDAVNVIQARHRTELSLHLALLEADKKAVAEQTDLIMTAERMYVLSTGEKTATGTFASRDPHLTIKRKPVSFVYDEKEMMIILENRPAKDGGTAARKRFIRVKKELNKVELNKAFAKGDVDWLPVEQAGRDIVITIEPLGDLLIMDDLLKKQPAKVNAPALPPIPAPVIAEVSKLAESGVNVNMRAKVISMVIESGVARWLNANPDRYLEVVQKAQAPV